MDRDFLRSPDILWLDSAAERWLDAYPIGNGRLGVMVFGGHATERLANQNEEEGSPDNLEGGNREARHYTKRADLPAWLGRPPRAFRKCEAKHLRQNPGATRCKRNARSLDHRRLAGIQPRHGGLHRQERGREVRGRTFADSIECVAQPQRTRQLRGAPAYSRFTAARTRSN